MKTELRLYKINDALFKKEWFDAVEKDIKDVSKADEVEFSPAENFNFEIVAK